MLTAVERHLELRDDVDVGDGAVVEVAIAHDLEHRRPQAAEPALFAEALADVEAPEQRPRRDVGVHRLIGADLRLHESVPRQDLPGHRVEAERRHAAAEALVAVAGRQRHLAEAADDRVVAGEEHALEPDGDVADAADARARTRRAGSRKESRVRSDCAR